MQEANRSRASEADGSTLIEDSNKRKSLGNLNTGQAAQMAYTNLTSQENFTPSKPG